MRIGVSSYSFDRLIKQGKMTQFDCVQKAKDLGFEFIDFTDLEPHDGSSEREYAQKIAKECSRVGIEVGSYTVYADLINGSNGVFDDEVARVKQKVDIANILGSKIMRHDATAGINPQIGIFKSFDALLPILIKDCRQITEHAKKMGIKTMVENHGFFAQDSKRVEKLINGVANDNFGVLIDMGNFMCVDENPTEAVGRLAPYALHIHAKDFHLKSGMEPDPGQGWFKSRGGNYLRGAIIGHGQVPIVQCLSILKKAGYNGLIAIEFEGMEDNIEALEIGYENLRKYMNV